MTTKHLNPAMLVALLALFLAISGTAAAKWYAPKNSVTSKSIKRGAVTSVKVKNNSLTGADIKESTLGKVPSAADADTVGGISPANFTTDQEMVTINVLVPEGQERSLIAFGPFNVIGKCITANPGVVVSTTVTTTGNGGYAYVAPGGLKDTNFSAPEVKNSSLGTSAAPDKLGTGSFDLHDPASGVVGMGSVHPYVNYGGEHCRFVGMATVIAP